METGLNLEGGSWGIGVTKNPVQEASDGEQNSCGEQGHAQQHLDGAEPRSDPLNAASSS
jgi:hypothetical protein